MKDGQLDEQMLLEDLEKIDGYFSGAFTPVERRSPGTTIASSDGRNFEVGETPNGFAPVYGRGQLVACVGTALANGTWSWTIGKVSDLHPFPVGPGHHDRNGDPRSWREDTLLGFLGRAEDAVNPDQDPAASWGGGTTIGGGPRGKDEAGNMSGSQFGPEEMLNLVREFVATLD
jgi:hypothetical protein